MTKLVDTTYKKGKLTHVDPLSSEISKSIDTKNGTEPITRKTISDKLSFLNEVKVSGIMTCCYFTKDNESFGDQIGEFQTGLLKLPAEFQLVDYTFNSQKRTLTINNKNDLEAGVGKRDHAILTNILLNLRESGRTSSTKLGTLIDNPHICEQQFDGDIVPFEHSCAGCSETCEIRGVIQPLIFYYDGGLYFHGYERDPMVDCKSPSPKIQFLIPMVLTERIVIYLVLDSEDKLKNIINYFLDPEVGAIRRKRVAIKNNLQLNDKLGIFVTREIELN